MLNSGKFYAIADFKLKIPDFVSLRLWWDYLKIEIREVCVSYSVRKRRIANAKRIALTKRLIRAKNLFHSGISNDLSVISDLEGQLSSLVTRQAERC